MERLQRYFGGLCYRKGDGRRLEQGEYLETFKRAKGQLKERLVKLNELLNHNLHTVTAPGMDYEK